MALTFAPYAPYHWLASAFVLVLILIYAVAFMRRRGYAIAGNAWARLGVMVFSLLAASAWALAAWNPVTTREPDADQPVHLAVVIDVSDSVLRADGGWPAVRQVIFGALQDGLRTVDPDVLASATASITTFRGSTITQILPLRDLTTQIQQLSNADFAGGDGSDIGVGLERAAQALDDNGGRGEIVLFSDGNATQGDALAAAQAISRRAIPITVYGIRSGAPELALTAVNLPDQTSARTETTLRGVIFNNGVSDVSATLEIQQNGGLLLTESGLFGEAQAASVTLPPLNARQYASLRQPVVFEGVGLQYIDLTLRDESQTVTHQRRFFTHVARPLRLLAIGGDVRWVAAIAPDVATVTAIAPAELGDTDLSEYDGFVISGVPASELTEADYERISKAVMQDGIGLMMINGDHAGADEAAETMLRSYHETPLDDLLPVTTDPRPFEPEPPPRQIVIYIDASGSMGGWPMQKAKEIANYIVQNLLRPEDRVDVVTFTTSAGHLINQQVQNEAGKQRTIAAINSIQAGGGTDPRAALELIRNRRMDNCGLIFLSDGYFSSGIASFRPDCRATVFGIGRNTIPAGDPLYELADPFEVDPSFNPATIDIPFFEPEVRDKFFERGGYTPLSMAFIGSGEGIPVPDLRLEGTAISYVKEDAELVVVRPKFIDPVLAYRRSGRGMVGVITTSLPDTWINAPDGAQAIQAWLLQIVGYSARDRYAFDIQDDGSVIDMQISLRDPQGGIPQIDLLAVQVELQGQIYSSGFTPIADEPATFGGALRLPRTDTAQLATLIIEEFGADGVARAQRIPFLIPPDGRTDSGTSSEATSYGLNGPLLREIAQLSGGQYNPSTDYAFFRQVAALTIIQAYWPILLVIGAVCYVLAVAMRKILGG